VRGGGLTSTSGLARSRQGLAALGRQPASGALPETPAIAIV
jgi:hypothetical protein